MTNMKPIVKTVHNPTVCRLSLAASAAPVLTSAAMSSIFSVASNPGIGNGSSTNQTRRKMMKYITPKNPANILATIPMNANWKTSIPERRGAPLT